MNERRILSVNSFIFNLSSLILLTSSLILFSCKDSTSGDNTVTVSGTVYLEDQTDHSGVKVSLYKPVELDTTLVRLNRQYPNIGVPITQATEFDHRNETPLYFTTSTPSGDWSIAKITPGTYNIVAEKDSFSWKYLLEYQTGSNITIDTLKSLRYLSGILNDDLNLKNCGVIIENLTIPVNTNLNISGQSYVLVAENAAVEVYGGFHVQGTVQSPVVISSVNIEGWRMIECLANSDLNLRYCKIMNAKNAVFNKTGTIIFENNIVMSNQIGFQNFNLSDSLNIQSNLFRKNMIGLYNSEIAKISIQKNLFLNNKIAMRCESTANFNLVNNISYEDSCSLEINNGLFFSNSTGSLSYCQFEKNTTAITIGGKATRITGMECNFLNSTSWFIGATRGNAEIDSSYFRSNYWEYNNNGLFQEYQIKERIMDSEDDITGKNGQFIDVSNFKENRIKIN